MHHWRVCAVRGEGDQVDVVAPLQRLLLLPAVSRHPHSSGLRRAGRVVGVRHTRCALPLLYPAHGPKQGWPVVF